jgi:type IV pilus assembly protein PilA
MKKLNQKGFSLVELMIVVAIIGILTAIAIPNFQRFQLKARQSEAKNNLAALFTAEKAFYGEWSSYLADFRDIGYRPEGRLFYRTGFGAAGINSPPTYVGGVSAGNAAPTRFSTGNYCGVSSNMPGVGIVCTENLVAGGVFSALDASWVTYTSNSGGYFTAGAVGDIRGSGSSDVDVWTINDSKVLTLLNNGID